MLRRAAPFAVLLVALAGCAKTEDQPSTEKPRPAAGSAAAPGTPMGATASLGGAAPVQPMQGGGTAAYGVAKDRARSAAGMAGAGAGSNAPAPDGE